MVPKEKSDATHQRATNHEKSTEAQASSEAQVTRCTTTTRLHEASRRRSDRTLAVTLRAASWLYVHDLSACPRNAGITGKIIEARSEAVLNRNSDFFHNQTNFATHPKRRSTSTTRNSQSSLKRGQGLEDHDGATLIADALRNAEQNPTHQVCRLCDPDDDEDDDDEPPATEHTWTAVP